MNPSSSAAPTRTSRAAYARLAILAAILAVVAFGAYRLGLFELRDPARLAVAIDRARELRALPLLFVLGYIASTVVGLPATIFTLAGGAIFGTVLGSVLNWIGATVGAIGAYALARRLGSDAVRQLLGRHRGALEALSTRADFAALFRLRLIPIVPFNALNFSAGFVPAPFRGYVASTALGIIPGTIVYTYFADSLVAGVTGASEQALWHVAIAGALLIAISFVPSLIRRFRSGRATRPGTC